MTDPIPCDIEHCDEYVEKAGLLVGRDGDLCYITVNGLDNVCDLYLESYALSELLDRLVIVEKELRGETD
jgi:hypothetical protein